MNHGRADPPISGASGMISDTPSTRDPYDDLDDLMTVVEALCPTWPERPLISGAGIWLL